MNLERSMISIRIYAESAQDARQQMLELLGGKLVSVQGTVPVPPSSTPTETASEPPKEPATEVKADKPVSGRTREKNKAKEAEAARNISSGADERVDPETEKQDAADEAAETAAAKAETKKLTHDDVRAVLGDYVKKFGMPAAQEDGPKVLTLIFGAGKAKVSDIPDEQEALGKAVAGIKEMLEKNPFKRDAVKAA